MPIPGVTASSNKHFHPDTLSYAARMKTAGDPLSASQQRAFDTLVKTMVAVGEWANVFEFYPILGSTLTGALVKGKVGSGKGSNLTNTNFISSDYTLSDGLGTAASTSKNLATGINLGVDIPWDNLSILFMGNHICEENSAGLAYWATSVTGIFLYRSGSAPGLIFRDDVATSNLATMPSGFLPNAGSVLVNVVSSADMRLYTNGVERLANTTARTQPSGGLVNVLNGMTKGTLWGMMLGNKFTVANIPSIQTALRTFYESVGRSHYDFICDGDQNLSLVNPYALQGAAKRLNSQNVSATSKSMATIYSNASSVYPALFRDPTKTIYWLHAGYIDLKPSTVGSGTNLFNNTLLPLVAYLQSLGITRIVIDTIMDANDTTTHTQYNTERSAFNTLLKNNAATYGYAVADLTTIAAVDTWANNGSWQTSNTLTVSGAATVGGVVAPVIASVY